jgi:hypothetical protein
MAPDAGSAVMLGGTTPVRRPWTAVLQRWPTVLALGLAALALGGDQSQQDAVASLSQALLVLPLEYLIVAKFQTRRATWPVIAVLLPATLVLLEVDLVDPTVLFSATALVVLAWSVVDGQLRRSGVFRVQALGMVGFGALALVGLAVDPELGLWLVAAGWLAHGIWDFVYLKLDKVVARSYAEWCGVLDVLIAAGLVLLW